MARSQSPRILLPLLTRKCNSVWIYLILDIFLSCFHCFVAETMILTTWSFVSGLAFGQPSSVSFLLLLMPASWSSTSHASPKKASPPLLASSSFTMLSRRWSSWQIITQSTRSSRWIISHISLVPVNHWVQVRECFIGSPICRQNISFVLFCVVFKLCRGPDNNVVD